MHESERWSSIVMLDVFQGIRGGNEVRQIFVRLKSKGECCAIKIPQSETVPGITPWLKEACSASGCKKKKTHTHTLPALPVLFRL